MQQRDYTSIYQALYKKIVTETCGASSTGNHIYFEVVEGNNKQQNNTYLVLRICFVNQNQARLFVQRLAKNDYNLTSKAHVGDEKAVQSVGNDSCVYLQLDELQIYCNINQAIAIPSNFKLQLGFKFDPVSPLSLTPSSLTPEDNAVLDLISKGNALVKVVDNNQVDIDFYLDQLADPQTRRPSRSVHRQKGYVGEVVTKVDLRTGKSSLHKIGSQRGAAKGYQHTKKTATTLLPSKPQYMTLFGSSGGFLWDVEKCDLKMQRGGLPKYAFESNATTDDCFWIGTSYLPSDSNRQIASIGQIKQNNENAVTKKNPISHNEILACLPKGVIDAIFINNDSLNERINKLRLMHYAKSKLKLTKNIPIIILETGKPERIYRYSERLHDVLTVLNGPSSQACQQLQHNNCKLLRDILKSVLPQVTIAVPEDDEFIRLLLQRCEQLGIKDLSYVPAMDLNVLKTSGPERVKTFLSYYQKGSLHLLQKKMKAALFNDCLEEFIQDSSIKFDHPKSNTFIAKYCLTQKQYAFVLCLANQSPIEPLTAQDQAQLLKELLLGKATKHLGVVNPVSDEKYFLVGYLIHNNFDFSKDRSTVNETALLGILNNKNYEPAVQDQFFAMCLPYANIDPAKLGELLLQLCQLKKLDLAKKVIDVIVAKNKPEANYPLLGFLAAHPETMDSLPDLLNVIPSLSQANWDDVQQNPLYHAVKNNKPDLVRQLLGRGLAAHINACFMLACAEENSEIIRLFLESPNCQAISNSSLSTALTQFVQKQSSADLPLIATILRNKNFEFDVSQLLRLIESLSTCHQQPLINMLFEHQQVRSCLLANEVNVIEQAYSKNNFTVIKKIWDIRCENNKEINPDSTNSLLHLAIQLNKPWAAVKLCKNFGIYERNSQGITPLQLALQAQLFELVSCMLTEGKGCEKPANHLVAEEVKSFIDYLEKGKKLTALHQALTDNNLNLFRWLCINGDVTARDKDGYSIMQLALADKRYDYVETLLDHAVDRFNDKEKNEFLLQLVEAGQLKFAEKLLPHIRVLHFPINESNGRNVLHYLANQPNDEHFLLAILAKNSACVSQEDKEQQTAMSLALAQNRSKLIGILLDQAGEHLSQRDLNECFCFAIRQKCFVLAEGVLKYLRLITDQAAFNEVLLLALNEKQMSIANKLAALPGFKLDIDFKDQEGNRILHYLLSLKSEHFSADYLELVKQLIQKGAPLSVKNNLQLTPIDVALSNPCIDDNTIEILINALDPKKCDPTTAGSLLLRLCELGKTNLADCLLDKVNVHLTFDSSFNDSKINDYTLAVLVNYFDVNNQDKKAAGYLLLKLSQLGKFDLAASLVSKSEVDWTLKDKEGYSALYYVWKNKQWDLFDSFMAKGADDIDCLKSVKKGSLEAKRIFAIDYLNKRFNQTETVQDVITLINRIKEIDYLFERRGVLQFSLIGSRFGDKGISKTGAEIIKLAKNRILSLLSRNPHLQLAPQTEIAVIQFLGDHRNRFGETTTSMTIYSLFKGNHDEKVLADAFLKRELTHSLAWLHKLGA